jgi:putative FmdB family regulatory protein
MPLFEYACRACGHRFEFLTRANQTPNCPACASAELEKQLSVFAVSKPAGSAASLGDARVAEACGTCGDPGGPGSCAIKYPSSSLN